MQLVITAVLLLLIALGWYLWNSSHSDGGSMNPFGQHSRFYPVILEISPYLLKKKN